MDVLRDYHYYYSVESTPDQATDPHYNIFSQKMLPINLHKVQTFDKISFQKVNDQIRFFLTCSSTKNWYIAVFHRRVLQIYDQITGDQVYEINMPSCRNIYFVDSEQLIIIQDGNANVFICSIEMQKRLF